LTFEQQQDAKSQRKIDPFGGEYPHDFVEPRRMQRIDAQQQAIIKTK
jgi:hypothetical protein